MDGSDRHLIAQLDQWGIGSPVWSPGGKWLLASIFNNNLPNPTPIPALIDPKTCEVIALAGIDGYVHGWAP
ncbi:MAG: hypothetical protein A2Z14_00550 [Chloroflexi bacterium RBG_16_48_8]|nr:MAG: hypothetical protein A2Z14_00550 [Chloroflexi bacterium RBG_16_48_8]